MYKLVEAVLNKKSPVVVGLDPQIENLPTSILKKYKIVKDDIKTQTCESCAKAIFEFNKGIIDSICDVVPAVKPQIAFYEMWGAAGYKAYEDTVEYAKKQGLYVLGDIKRADIGSTCRAYAYGHFKSVKADALTINPYLGTDGITPFIEVAQKEEKSIFVLVKTSNPSSGEIQDMFSGEKKIYEHVAKHVDKWGEDHIDKSGYSLVGAVVGATYPQELRKLRQDMPNTYFLIPGYGAQGARAKDIVWGFSQNGLGALINSSRGILYAYQKTKEDYQLSARQASLDMTEKIKSALKQERKILIC